MNGAECADHQPVRERKRHAEIGDNAEISDGGVVTDQGMYPGVLNDEGRSARHDVLAKGVRKRGLTPRGPGLRQPNGAFENLPLCV
jgi:hypothetical protein